MSACTEHSLLPPSNVLSRLSSSPRATNTDVRRAGWRFGVCPLSLSTFPGSMCSAFAGKISEMLPRTASGSARPAGLSLSSYPVNRAFSGHCCWSVTHCGLQGIGKTFGRHQRPSGILKTTLKNPIFLPVRFVRAELGQQLMPVKITSFVLNVQGQPGAFQWKIFFPANKRYLDVKITSGIPLKLFFPHALQHFLEVAANKWLLRRGRICYSLLSKGARTLPEKSFWG